MIRVLIATFLLITGCATSSGVKSVDSASYARVVDKNSDQIRRYSGFYNTLDVEATFLNSELLTTQVEYLSGLYQWTEEKKKEEAGKILAPSQTQTQFFMSFFTPERKNSQLTKKDTVWKFFMDVEGRRYEGTVTRLKTPMAEIEILYPYFNRFYIPYILSFPVPTAAVEGKTLELTVTGAVDSGNLHFNKN